MQADFTGGQIGLDLLVVIRFQIDGAIVAEAGDPLAGLGVQRDQLIAGRDIQNAGFLAVAPIGWTAAGKLTRAIP